MVVALNGYLRPLSPPQFQFQLTVEQMAEPSVSLFVARDASGQAIGMGALKEHGGGLGEVKRMYTAPQFRGRGVGAALLGHIEALARSKGVLRLVLETGAMSEMSDSWRLYERAGFSRCGAVLDYPASSYNRFYEKSLRP
jgi:putative acetyltransferase